MLMVKYGVYQIDTIFNHVNDQFATKAAGLWVSVFSIKLVYECHIVTCLSSF